VTTCEWSREIPSKSTPGKTYTLSWGRDYNLLLDRIVTGYMCTCWPFRSKRICEHTRAAYERDRADPKGPEDRCGWRGEDGIPDNEGKCPCCGAETYVFSYGA